MVTKQDFQPHCYDKACSIKKSVVPAEPNVFLHIYQNKLRIFCQSGLHPQ